MLFFFKRGFTVCSLRAGPVSSVEHPGRRFLISGGALANTPNMEGGGGVEPILLNQEDQGSKFQIVKK